MALHSPLLAAALQDAGEKTAISLPFQLSSLVALVDLISGRHCAGASRELQSLASCLGIDLKSEDNIKMELVSELEETDDHHSDLKHADLKREETEEKVQNSRVQAFDEEESNFFEARDSDESSEEDDNDPDFVTNTSSPTKPRKRTNISEGSKRGRGRPRTRKEPKEEFQCDHCDRSFKIHRLMLKHCLEKHNIPISCDSCEDQFSKWESYKKHVSEKHPRHTCDVCGEKKFTATALAIHIESKHQDDLPCPQCGLMFATKTSLNHHIGKNHGQYEIIQCEKCDFTTRVAAIMRNHFKRKHMADMKQTCDVCGETFKELHLHLSRTACGKSERKYNCDQCEKTFFTRPSLKQHIQRVHNTVRVKDKFCSQCSYSTYSNYNLKLHVTSAHHGNILVKQVCPYCEKVSKSLSYHISVYHPEKLDFHSNTLEQNKDQLSLQSEFTK